MTCRIYKLINRDFKDLDLNEFTELLEISSNFDLEFKTEAKMNYFLKNLPKSIKIKQYIVLENYMKQTIRSK